MNCSTNATRRKIAHFYGDSISKGDPGVTTLGWCRLLAKAKGWDPIVNAVQGTTMMGRVPVNPINSTPNMWDNRNNIITYDANRDVALFISYCINDCGWNFTNYSVANYGSDADDVIVAAINKGWPLNRIIMSASTLVDSDYWDDYDATGVPLGNGYATANDTRYLAMQAELQSKCTSRGVVFMNPYTYMQNNGGFTLLGDGRHPNAAGYVAIKDYYMANLSPSL